MTTTVVSAALRDYLAANDLDSIRVAPKGQHAADIANDIGEPLPADASSILLLLPERQQAELFGYLDPATQVAIARM